jgi:type IV pilus assembly protein PilV
MKLNQNGLSLLEVMISMILLALGLLSMAPMVVLSIEGNNISRDVMTVSEMAKEKIEFYKDADPFPAIPLSETEATIYGGYNRYTKIEDSTTDASIPGGLYEITIYITWTDKTGVDRSTSYSTYIQK